MRKVINVFLISFVVLLLSNIFSINIANAESVEKDVPLIQSWFGYEICSKDSSENGEIRKMELNRKRNGDCLGANYSNLYFLHEKELKVTEPFILNYKTTIKTPNVTKVYLPQGVEVLNKNHIYSENEKYSDTLYTHQFDIKKFDSVKDNVITFENDKFDSRTIMLNLVASTEGLKNIKMEGFLKNELVYEDTFTINVVKKENFITYKVDKTQTKINIFRSFSSIPLPNPKYSHLGEGGNFKIEINGDFESSLPVNTSLPYTTDKEKCQSQDIETDGKIYCSEIEIKPISDDSEGIVNITYNTNNIYLEISGQHIQSGIDKIVMIEDTTPTPIKEVTNKEGETSVKPYKEEFDPKTLIPYSPILIPLLFLPLIPLFRREDVVIKKVEDKENVYVLIRKRRVLNKKELTVSVKGLVDDKFEEVTRFIFKGQYEMDRVEEIEFELEEDYSVIKVELPHGEVNRAKKENREINN